MMGEYEVGRDPVDKLPFWAAGADVMIDWDAYTDEELADLFTEFQWYRPRVVDAGYVGTKHKFRQIVRHMQRRRRNADLPKLKTVWWGKETSGVGGDTLDLRPNQTFDDGKRPHRQSTVERNSRLIAQVYEAMGDGFHVGRYGSPDWVLEVCLRCGSPIENGNRGQQRKYCSVGCRNDQRNERRRRRRRKQKPQGPAFTLDTITIAGVGVVNISPEAWNAIDKSEPPYVPGPKQPWFTQKFGVPARSQLLSDADIRAVLPGEPEGMGEVDWDSVPAARDEVLRGVPDRVLPLDGVRVRFGSDRDMVRAWLLYLRVAHSIDGPDQSTTNPVSLPNRDQNQVENGLANAYGCEVDALVSADLTCVAEPLDRLCRNPLFTENMLPAAPIRKETA